jgi:hypothetical protein
MKLLVRQTLTINFRNMVSTVTCWEVLPVRERLFVSGTGVELGVVGWCIDGILGFEMFSDRNVCRNA